MQICISSVFATMYMSMMLGMTTCGLQASQAESLWRDKGVQHYIDRITHVHIAHTLLLANALMDIWQLLDQEHSERQRLHVVVVCA